MSESESPEEVRSVSQSRVFVTKSDLAYSRIRERILSGAFAPGTAINQELVASEIGVSTTPVREALRRLKSEGLIQLDAHRDARITPLTSREARDLFEVRQALDTLAVGLAAQRRSTKDIDTMRASARRLRSAIGGTEEDSLEAHREFHAALYRASHNEVLIASLDSLFDKSVRYRRLARHIVSTSDALQLRDYEEHAILMEMVIGQDTEQAMEQMRKHVMESLGRLTEPIGDQD